MVKKTRRWLFPLLLFTLSSLLLVGCVKQEEATVEENKPNSSLGLTIGYAEGVTEVEDPEALQKMVDEVFASADKPPFALEYKNGAYSEDGVNFSCYIANAASNEYDMFICVYADAALTDELYVSQLLRPGTAFDQITLNRKLEPGVHRVYVPHTQIAIEDGEQTIMAQNTVTMDFIVNE
jgi:hypothetical protein